MAKKVKKKSGGCLTLIIGAVVLLVIAGALFGGNDSDDTGQSASESTTESFTADPFSGFTMGWHYSTKRDRQYYIYDPSSNKLVEIFKSSDYYDEWDCIGNLDDGLHRLDSEGNPYKSYFIYKTILNSRYVVEIDANGKYDEFDIFSIDKADGLTYLRKTSYLKDHGMD